MQIKLLLEKNMIKNYLINYLIVIICLYKEFHFIKIIQSCLTIAVSS